MSGAHAVVAECDGPVPSFGDVAPTAGQVIIGDVVAIQSGGLWPPDADGRSSRFTLQVRYVLAGDAPATMEIRDLPTQPCAPVMFAAVGDRVALALDGMDFDPPIPVNTIAWIRGTSPDVIGIETMTVGEVFALFGLQAPATSTISGPVRTGPAGDATAPIVVLMFALVGLSVGWRRFSAVTPRAVRIAQRPRG